MKKNSDVTVIMPCYNDGEYILEALNSVLNQTLLPEKIIIVDDGSNEITRNLLKTIEHPLLQIIYQNNKGVSVARNVAIGFADTRYILNLDADDYFEPSFIEKAVKVLNENENIGVVGCWYRDFKDKKKNNSIIKPIGGTVDNFLYKNNTIACSMYRKQCWEAVSGYDEKMLNGYEDWDFWIGILSNHWSVYIIEEQLFNYRLKSKSRDTIALANFDFELKKYIFLKHKAVFFQNYELFSLQLIQKNSELSFISKSTKNSLNYRIGTIVLNPLRILKVLKNKLFR